MSNRFRSLFVAEVVVIVLVVLTFRSFSERLVAGAIAGTLFVALGVAVLAMLFRSPETRRSPTMIVGCVHLFGVALPMMITRFANAALSFEKVEILGLPGPMFHQLANVVYLSLIAVTGFDWWRWKRQERK